MAFAFHPGKQNKVRKESGRDSPKNNLFSSSPQSEKRAVNSLDLLFRDGVT